MSVFGLTEEKMRETASGYTLHEIDQQPAAWRRTFAQMSACREKLRDFLERVVGKEDFDIVLSGAGSSEFVGNALFHALNPKYGHKVKSYASTDLVTFPESILSRTKPTLLVSFGRSGDSPESIGSVEAAEAVCENLQHLFITCNRAGELYRMAQTRRNCFAIALPPETHDQGFAMTSSYSCMYLAAYLSFHLDALDEILPQVEKICEAGRNFLDNQYPAVREIVQGFDFDRIVYLGSAALKGVAQESALKMLELTAGRVCTMYDSELGFRHGPKSIIHDRTLVVAYLSDNEHSRRYELDLIKEMAEQRKGNRIAVVYNRSCSGIEELADYPLRMRLGQEMENVLLGLAFVPFAQTLAVMKSLALGVTPDDPCPTGEVNRVVKGVTLYAYPRR